MVDNDKKIRKLFRAICIAIAFVVSFLLAFELSAGNTILLFMFWYVIFFMSIVFISMLFEPICSRMSRF